MPEKKQPPRQDPNNQMPDEVQFEDGLTPENLAAVAIWEQIELNRRKNESSSPESNTQPPQIDPGFQNVYDNI